ncbi:MAG: alpha/beta fold hydrolase, partial [Thermoanaerobaculia bacterium]|nr:alpha/beta fold hydrolase [Thermoanaerobaculia bacterium]
METTIRLEPGIDLFARRAGSGPAVVIPGDFLLFQDLCSLAEDLTVVFYDMRNRGRSGRVTDGGRLTLEADVRDLEAVRSHYDLPHVSLVGYSYLGKMIVLYALEHPERTERLVQLGAVPMDPDRPFPPDQREVREIPEEELRPPRELQAEGFHEERPSEYCEREREVIAPLLVGDPDNVANLSPRCHLPNEWPVNLAFHMEHHYLASSRHVVVSSTEASRVEAPVLTIHGTRDRNAPYGGGREWAASLPGARLLALPGVAHAIPAEVELTPILRSFLRGRWPEGSETVDPATDATRSQLKAWDLVKEAHSLHVSEPWPPGRAFRMVFEGALFLRSQGRSAEPPFDPFPVHTEIVVGPEGDRLEWTEELQWPDFLARHRVVVNPEESFTVNLATGAVSSPYTEARELLARAIRRHPGLLLREILDEPASLRFAGVRVDDDERLAVVSGLHRGERLDLLLGRGGRLLGFGRIVDEPMYGDAYEEIRFLGEGSFDELPGPERIERELVGLASTADLEVIEAELLPLEATDFGRPLSVPAGEDADMDRAEGEPPSTAERTASFDQLAPEIWLATIPGRQDYRSLVVERKDHLVLGEAPLGVEETNDLLEILATRFPDKPVRWVVVTHHHFDHSAGIPTAAEAGATVVTTPGNRELFLRAITAPQTVRGEGIPKVEPEIRVVEERLSIPGGLPEVVAISTGPNAHVEEMLVLHLPAEGILFQGDFLRFPATPDDPLRPQARDLLRIIEELDLAVDRIA